jgi:1-deoxy-D-xylulose-5-phosphate reductoisomerase
MNQVSVLGVTGSIGTSSLDVISRYPEQYRLYSVAAHSNWQKTAEIVKKFQPEKVAMWNPEAAEKLSKELNCEVLQGMEGLLELCSDKQTDVVINGLVGSVGCLPTIRAIECGKRVGLANKETLVMAGEVIEKKLKENPKAILLPIDSEHSAIFQCLAERPVSEVESIQLTASGGPFRNLPLADFNSITIEQALKHPTWSMGPKITIDSATLMNKGLEVIEAHFLFRVSYDQIKVVVHPQSIIHSMVQFVDGSLMAQLGAPDMRVPIQLSLSYPRRLPLPCERVDLAALQQLSFSAPDFQKFPCLRLAYQAGRRGGTAPAILNAANEVLVPQFLAGKIQFTDIPRLLESCLEDSVIADQPDLNTILTADAQARQLASAKVSASGVLQT